MFHSGLFSGTSLHDLFQDEIRRSIERDIDQMSLSELDQDLDGMIAHFEQKHDVDIPVLQRDLAYADEPSDQSTNPSVKLKLHIPFTGDLQGFAIQASSRPIFMEPISQEKNELTFMYTVDRNRPQDVVNKLDEFANRISDGLNTLRIEFGRHKKQIADWVKARVQLRKQQLTSDNQFRQTLSSIIPMKKREEAVKVITPSKLKPLPVTPQKVSATEPANPIIEMSAYEDVLKTIQSMVHVFERSPETFREMDEEDLRMILLVALNGLYGGEATGETFNGIGKTDILIRHEDKNVFIAECLIWKGQNILREKMDDQLFKYATWRDSKLAILVFNRNKGFTEVIAKMKETVAAHPQCVSSLPFAHQSGARFQFKRADDSQKKFILTCLAFDVP